MSDGFLKEAKRHLVKITGQYPLSATAVEDDIVRYCYHLRKQTTIEAVLKELESEADRELPPSPDGNTADQTEPQVGNEASSEGGPETGEA
jgi:hypothetical protein